MTDADEKDQTVGLAVLHEAAGIAETIFGDELVSVYAFGSLTHGGFDPLVSDIDILFVLRGPLTEETRRRLNLVEEVVVLRALPLADRLATFWTSLALLPRRDLSGAYPPKDISLGFLPPLDRLDLLLNGTLLFGDDVRRSIPRPTSEELEIAGVEFAVSYLQGDALLEEIKDARLLEERGVLAVTKTILFPVRFLYTLRTGQIGANYDAAQHYGASSEPGARSRLVAAALEWRRSGLPQDGRCVALITGGLGSLYREMLEAYRDRMEELGRADLAAALDAWARDIRAVDSGRLTVAPPRP